VNEVNSHITEISILFQN